MADDSPERSPPAREVPNVWALSSGRNPYLHNVFALLGIDPDEEAGAFDRKCDRIRKRIASQESVVHGYKIEATDVTRAKGLMKKGGDYVAERLLAHTSHKVDVDAFEEPMAAIEALTFQQPGDLLPLPIRDLSFLTRLLPELADVAAGEPQALSNERLAALLQPDPAEEQILDL